MECVNNVKVGSGHLFVVLGVHVRMLTPINWLPHQHKLCMNINDLYIGNSF